MRFVLILTVGFISISSFSLANEKTLSSYYDEIKENCHAIECVRSEMDRINLEILRLLTERTAYVKRAGDLKSRTTRVADDRQRVADQENRIIHQSGELELPIEISVPAFQIIMETSIRFQQDYINQLTADNRL